MTCEILAWSFLTAIVVVGILVVICPISCCRLLVGFLRITVIKLRRVGEENIPRRGAALLVANHVAFFDALIIFGITRRPVRFMVHENFFKYTFLRIFFNYLGVIKVPATSHVRAMRLFIEDVRDHLRRGHLVCVFPEGGISDNGLLQEFHDNIGELLPPEKRDEIPMIPIRLGMLWGRLFTLYKGRLRFLPPRHMPIIISVAAGKRVDPSLSGFKLRQIISELGADVERKPFPGELPLHAQFARRVRFRPWMRSFKDYNGGDLNDFTILARALLLSRLVRKYDKNGSSSYVAVMLPNSTIQVAVLLGVMFADRSPAVLNYTAGIDALRTAVDKSRTRLIITSRKFLEKLNLPEMPDMLFLEDVAPEITGWQKAKTLLRCLFMPYTALVRYYAPESCHDLERPAVLLFSSGSTGKPKGVMLSHRNINSNVLSFWRGINWSPCDKIIGALPLFHAFGFTVCFSFPVLSGTKSIFLANILDGGTVVRLVREEKITLMVTTPTFLQNYMRKATVDDFRSLRLVITGAEKLRSDISEKFNALTGLSIVEGYGCTELSPIVCINLSSSFMELGKRAGKPDSIGVAMPGVHVKVVDPDSGEELPPDTPGMLLIKGGLVMKGYLDAPEETAAVISPDGFYRTGDIAAINTDGHIVITGRLSRFSKIAGEMVPHEMVERAIAENLRRDDRCIAVGGRSDIRRGEKLLVFYSVSDLDVDGVIADLRRMSLPNLWIPKREDFIFVEKMPLLGSGKLDLQALKKMAETC